MFSRMTYQKELHPSEKEDTSFASSWSQGPSQLTVRYTSYRQTDSSQIESPLVRIHSHNLQFVKLHFLVRGQDQNPRDPHMFGLLQHEPDHAGDILRIKGPGDVEILHEASLHNPHLGKYPLYRNIPGNLTDFQSG